MHQPATSTSAGDAAPAATATRRSTVLLEMYRRLADDLGIRPFAAERIERETAESLAPHPALRRCLQDDPAMAALLPGAAGRFALGAPDDLPFSVLPDGLIILPPTLLDDSPAMAAAARWGLEAAHARTCAADAGVLIGLVRHGTGLLASLPATSRNLLLALLPRPIANELWGGRSESPSDVLLAWMSARTGTAPVRRGSDGDGDAGGLVVPVERLLVAGGDSRLHVDPVTGHNRYGVPPRPRPEAVQFSSSTASAVSEHGFLFCDVLRRDLLTAVRVDGVPVATLRRNAAVATGNAIARMLGLDHDECDVAIAPSGTDSELLAVLVARAGAERRPVLNLLVSPEESGRGVRLAGSGRFFDDEAATGAHVSSGAPAFADGPVDVEEVAIRDESGRPRLLAEVDSEFLSAGRAALARGCHVLAHVLLSSKTGLSAPSTAAVNALRSTAPDRVDVVVDACQMRTPFALLGQIVRNGWMLQVSGSKFLTGPPFSGALVLPPAMRPRAAAIGTMLAESPGVGHPHDWPASSFDMPAQDGPPPSFGSIFRWLPALLESELLVSMPIDFRAEAFDRFRDAVAPSIEHSPWLSPIETGAPDDAPHDASLGLSILSFSVRGRLWNGGLATLGESECRALFEALNRDVSALLPGLDLADAALARLPAHIGQPVTLAGPDGPVSVLRMVLGARFFSIVGFAPAGAEEAALRSEIADARRAIAKVELLAEHWWRIGPALEQQ
ncbi:MAG: hypothetical protein ACOYMR_06850 [Ilumatobacteraceae bacterium]